MTKMIKLSLAAAVATAGMTTIASAADVSYKGKVYVEHYTTSVNDAHSTRNFDIDADITATVKINDNFSAVATLEADTENDDTYIYNQPAVLNDTNFVYTNAGATVVFGRQGINTPNTDGENGEGVVASYTTNGLTAVVAHFINNDAYLHNYSGDVDVNAVALLGSVSGVDFELWNVAAAGVATNNTLVVGSNVAGISLGLRYATTSWDDDHYYYGGKKDGSTMIFSAGANVSGVDVSFAYLVTGEDGAAYTTDASSANTAELDNFTAAGSADTTAMILGASMDIGSGYAVAFDYGTADIGDDDDISEMVLTVSKSFAKDLSGSVYYSDYKGTTTASDKATAGVDLTYKF
jgi:hypothetical protein